MTWTLDMVHVVHSFTRPLAACSQVMGSLAMEPPVPGKQLQGILVKRNFNYHILAPEDLNSEICLLFDEEDE